MAYISKFQSGVAYSNTDINEIISTITGEGVLPLTPNDVLASVAESGVTLSDKRCAVSWADNNDKSSVVIGAGTVIMPDGSYIIIADEILPVSSSATHYVFIYNDLVLQNVPKCETSLPADGRPYVLLAEVQGGKIADKRTLAKSKISDYGTHPVIITNLDCSGDGTPIEGGTLLATMEIDPSYSYILVATNSENFYGLYNLSTQLFDFTTRNSEDYLSKNVKYVYTGTTMRTIHLTYVDGILSVIAAEGYYSSDNITNILKLKIF